MTSYIDRVCRFSNGDVVVVDASSIGRDAQRRDKDTRARRDFLCHSTSTIISLFKLVCTVCFSYSVWFLVGYFVLVLFGPAVVVVGWFSNPPLSTRSHRPASDIISENIPCIYKHVRHVCRHSFGVYHIFFTSLLHRLGGWGGSQSTKKWVDADGDADADADGSVS